MYLYVDVKLTREMRISYLTMIRKCAVDQAGRMNISNTNTDRYTTAVKGTGQIAKYYRPTVMKLVKDRKLLGQLPRDMRSYAGRSSAPSFCQLSSG